MMTASQKTTLSVVSFIVGVGATALAFRLGVDNGNPGEMVGPFLIAFAMVWPLGFAQALELVRKPYKLWTVVGQLFAGSLAMLAFLGAYNAYETSATNGAHEAALVASVFGLVSIGAGLLTWAYAPTSDTPTTEAAA